MFPVSGEKYRLAFRYLKTRPVVFGPGYRSLSKLHLIPCALPRAYPGSVVHKGEDPGAFLLGTIVNLAYIRDEEYW